MKRTRLNTENEVETYGTRHGRLIVNTYPEKKQIHFSEPYPAIGNNGQQAHRLRKKAVAWCASFPKKSEGMSFRMFLADGTEV